MHIIRENVKGIHKLSWIYNHSFKTRPGESTRDPFDPGLELGRVYEKIRVVKNPADTVKNPIAIR
jgi:hypothetical protein